MVAIVLFTGCDGGGGGTTGGSSSSGRRGGLATEQNVELPTAPVKRDTQEKTPEPAHGWPGTYQGKMYPVVRDVASGGIGDMAGVKVGDIYLMYNGTSLENLRADKMEVYHKAVQEAGRKGLDTVTIRLVRGGAVYEKKIPAGVLLTVYVNTPF
jgi:S1-C subfamily serine protease